MDAVATEIRQISLEASNLIVKQPAISSAITLHPVQSQLPAPTDSQIYPHLPVEVCERIIDAIGAEHIYEYGLNNTKTLLACCLTSREWFHRASRYLYTEVALYVHKISSFVEVLVKRPEVGKFVKTLQVWQHEGQPHMDLCLLRKCFPQNMPNLTRLEFYDVDFGVVSGNFSTHLPNFVTVTSILYGEAKFNTLHELYTQLSAFPHLVDLVLSHPRFHSLDAGKPLSTRLTRRCTHKLRIPTAYLDLYNSNDVHIFELFSPTSITTLTLWFRDDIDGTTVPALASFLHSAQDTLRYFQLHVHSNIHSDLQIGELFVSFFIFINDHSC